MSNVIRVDTQNLMNYAERILNLQRRLIAVQWELSNLYAQTHLPALSRIANRRMVSQCTSTLERCWNWCMETMQDFQIVENYLAKQDPENFVRPKNLVINEYHGNSTSNMLGKSIRDGAGVIGSVGSAADDSNLKNTGKVLGYVGSVEKVLSGDGTEEERIKNYADLLKKSIGIEELIYNSEFKKMKGWNEDLTKIDPKSEAGKYLAKYADKLNLAGMFGEVITTVAGLWESSYGKSVDEFLLEFHELVDSGESVATALQKMIPKKITGDAEKLMGDLAAISAIFSMETTALGDIWRAMEDGVYTVDEYGNTCLRTGVTGMSSLLSAYTFGLVDIDTDEAFNTYQDNITWAQDWIRSTTDNTAAQVALSVPVSVIVAAGSTVQVAGEALIKTGGKLISFGESIGDWIMSCFH